MLKKKLNLILSMVLSLLGALTTKIAWSVVRVPSSQKTYEELIATVQAITYRPEHYGLKSFEIEAQFDAIDPEIKNQFLQIDLGQVSFFLKAGNKIKESLFIQGVPLDFIQLKRVLEIEFFSLWFEIQPPPPLMPESEFLIKIKSIGDEFLVEAERRPEKVKSNADIQNFTYLYDAEGRLQSATLAIPELEIKAEYHWQKYPWSQNKWVLKEIVITKKQLGQIWQTTNKMTYAKIQSWGLPVAVESFTKVADGKGVLAPLKAKVLHWKYASINELPIEKYETPSKR